MRGVLAEEMHDYIDILNSGKRDTEGYVGTFKSLDKYMVKQDVSDKAITEELIYGWLKTLACGYTTKNRKISNIRKFSRYLTALGIPAYEPDFCRAASPYVAHTFTNEEFAAIINAADNFTGDWIVTETAYIFPVMLRVFYGCGLRVGEALSLRWGDVNLETGIISIREAKNQKQRRVPISGSLTKVLEMYRNRRNPGHDETAYLFANTSRNGTPYTNNAFRLWFLNILDQVNINNQRTEPWERCISTHTLRHYFTFKSFEKAVEDGLSLDEFAPYLSEYLGHTSFCGTEKYLTSDYTMYTDSQERVSRAIESVFPEVVFE